MAGAYLLLVQLLNGNLQLGGRLKALIAEVLVVETVAGDMVVIASELAEQHRPALLVRLEVVLAEVHMAADYLAHTLVMPAGGVVNSAAGVDGTDIVVHLCCVELAPSPR